MRRTLTAAISAALIWVAVAPADAEVVSGRCTTDSGVTLVVDATALGGSLDVRCIEDVAPGTTGLQLLQQAGYTAQGTAHDGPGFVCRINGMPGVNDTLQVGGRDYREACVSTPPAGAFWGYWHAPNGGPWTFSNYGGASREVILGGYEGWAFSLGNTRETNPAPGIEPSHTVVAPATPTPVQTTAVPAPPPVSTTTPPPARATQAATTQAPAKPTQQPTQAASTTRTSTAPASASASATASAAATATPSASPTASVTPEPSPTAEASATVESSPSVTPTASVTPVVTEASPPADGLPTGTIIGVGSVAALGIAGGIVWWRRRGLE